MQQEIIVQKRVNMAKLYKVKRKSDKEMLRWAKDSLDQNTYHLIRSSYNRYRFFQILLPTIYLIALMVVCIPFKKYAIYISCIGATLFVLVLAVWTIITRHIFAKVWTKFSNLYNSNARPKNIINELNRTN